MFTKALAVAPLIMILLFTSENILQLQGICPWKENISQKSAYKTEEAQFGDIDGIHNNQDNIDDEDAENQSELQKVYGLNFKIKVAV